MLAVIGFGICGFGMAAELTAMRIEENFEYITHLETHFIRKFDEKGIDYKINGIERIPGVFNMTFPDIDGQNLVMQLDMAGIGISFGSACASGTAKASTMLQNMGITKQDALSTVRISFGKIHSLQDVKTVTNTIQQIMIQQNEQFLIHEG